MAKTRALAGRCRAQPSACSGGRPGGLSRRKGSRSPSDEVAKRAGLGVGTLYRTFPDSKDAALFLAIVIDRMERLVADAQRIALCA